MINDYTVSQRKSFRKKKPALINWKLIVCGPNVWEHQAVQPYIQVLFKPHMINVMLTHVGCQNFLSKKDCNVIYGNAVTVEKNYGWIHGRGRSLCSCTFKTNWTIKSFRVSWKGANFKHFLQFYHAKLSNKYFLTKKLKTSAKSQSFISYVVKLL